MGQVDVNDALDLDMLDPVTIVRRLPTVDSYGQNQIVEEKFPTYGSVQPASGRTLQRLPDLLRVENVSSFWIKGKIVSDGKTLYPDVIMYKGSRYQVQAIFDWTNWGPGFCEGTCIREKAAL